MNWKNFEESKSNFPEKIAKEVMNGFESATQELAELTIEQISSMKAWRFFGDIADVMLIDIFIKPPKVEIININISISKTGEIQYN